MADIGDLIRLFGETDWHEVIGTSTLGTLQCYELSDGRIVSLRGIEAVLEQGAIT